MKQDDLFRRGVRVKDMKKIQESMEEAHKDDTPFATATKEGLVVMGDVNKTEPKYRSYEVEFHFDPLEVEKFHIDEEDIERYVDGQAVVHMTFDDVTIKPRHRLEVDAAIVKILPYFYKISEEKNEVSERTDEELRDLVNDMCIEIGDDMYNLVAAVLRVDRRIVENMEWQSVMDTITKIIEDFPEVFNESESTFPSSGTDRR
jgi:hypothetical protein